MHAKNTFIKIIIRPKVYYLWNNVSSRNNGLNDKTQWFLLIVMISLNHYNIPAVGGIVGCTPETKLFKYLQIYIRYLHSFSICVCSNSIVNTPIIPSCWFRWGQKIIKKWQQIKIPCHLPDNIFKSWWSLSCYLGEGIWHVRVKKLPLINIQF